MVLRRTIRNSHPFVLGTRPAVALGYQMIRVIQRAAGEIGSFGCPRNDDVNRGATVATKVTGNSVTAHGVIIHEYLGRPLNLYLSERHRNERYKKIRQPDADSSYNGRHRASKVYLLDDM